MVMDLGFVGLGRMGGAIAERLLTTDHRLHVFDTASPAMLRFTQRGAVAHASPRAVADAAPIVFACLPTREVSEAVGFGNDGVLGGARLRTYVEMSTIGRECLLRIADRLGAAGVAVVDSPVSGGPEGARAGTLSVMAAGSPNALEVVRPLLRLIGGRVFEVGDRPGLAQAMKLVNNLINAANMAAAFEALVLGAKAGLDPDTMVAVINASTGRNSATLDKVPKAVLTGSFDYGARLSTMHKDVTLGLEEARALAVPMFVNEAVEQLWRFGVTQGKGEEDFTALIKLIEGWAGAEVRSRGTNDPPGR
jgi:3-hydroxyisobutyrate dehydrogenase-like beta-hydroxyacid dehydrogenase